MMDMNDPTLQFQSMQDLYISIQISRNISGLVFVYQHRIMHYFNIRNGILFVVLRTLQVLAKLAVSKIVHTVLYKNNNSI